MSVGNASLTPKLAKGYGQIVHTLPIDTDGGRQWMNCANTEGIFHIIQSIPKNLAISWRLPGDFGDYLAICNAN